MLSIRRRECWNRSTRCTIHVRLLFLHDVSRTVMSRLSSAKPLSHVAASARHTLIWHLTFSYVIKTRNFASITAFTTLSKGLHLGMHNAHVPCQRIVARERLLLSTHGTPDFHGAVVVDRILMTRQVVRPREYSVTRLVGGWVDARALVWPSL